MPRLWRHATLRSALLVLSAGLVAGAMYVYYDRKPGYWQDGAMVVLWPLVLAVGVAGMLVCLTRATSAVHAATRWTGLAYLGVISFGIYLFHPFVIEALDRAWFANGRTVSALPFILVALAATVLVSMMFHYVRRTTGDELGSAARRRSAGITRSAPHGRRPAQPRDGARSPVTRRR